MEYRALWFEGYLMIDGRVWAMDVSIDEAAQILSEVQQEFPKSAPRSMYVEVPGWF
jgi:hypothetical protein